MKLKSITERKREMELRDFFKFGGKYFGTTFRAPPVFNQGKSDENWLKDVNDLIHGDYANIDFPVVFKQSDGKRFHDILETGFHNLYLISNRMKTILEENHFSGWKIFPIRLFDKKGKEIFGYHGFSVVGRSGPVDWNKSEIVPKQRFPGGPVFNYLKGFHIGLDRWDQTDFFIPEKTLAIVITKQVAKVLKNNKITNMELQNLTEAGSREADKLSDE